MFIMPSTEEWQSGKVKLQAMGLELQLRDGVFFREVGRDTDELPLHGITFRTFMDKRWEFDVRYTCNPKAQDMTIYVQGHEEGHVCQLTGNLQKAVDEAVKLNLKFKFIDLFEVQRSDYDHNRILDSQGVPSKITGRLSEVYYAGYEEIRQKHERFADIGGVVAMVKAGVERKTIGDVMEVLNTTRSHDKVMTYWIKKYEGRVPLPVSAQT